MWTRSRFVPMFGVALLVVGSIFVVGLAPRSHAQKPQDSDLAPPSEPPSPIPVAGQPADAASPLPLPIGNAADAAPRPIQVPTEAVVPAQPADDPEKNVQDFLHRTRQEADAAVKSLTAESESLRARLKKVEASLKRWQGIQAALGENPDQAQNSRTEWREAPGGRVEGRPADRPHPVATSPPRQPALLPPGPTETPPPVSEPAQKK